MPCRRYCAAGCPTSRSLEVASHNWTADPLFQGTWAVPAPNRLLPGLEALEARDGRVLLAGADLASGSFGLIDGAIQTGTRAGRDAVALLRTEH